MSTARGTMARIPPCLRFVLLCVISLVIGWHSLFSIFVLALRVDEYTHLLLIVPISVSLIFSEQDLLKLAPEPAVGLGSFFLIAATLIGAFSRTISQIDLQLSFNMLAIVIWWIGSFVLCFGTRTARLVLFPLCFLFWLVPIPAPLLEKIVVIWQHGSAISASLLFSALGIPNSA